MSAGLLTMVIITRVEGTATARKVKVTPMAAHLARCLTDAGQQHLFRWLSRTGQLKNGTLSRRERWDIDKSGEE